MKCLSCGWDEEEEKCSHVRITDGHSRAIYIVVHCGRNGTVLFKEVRQ